MCGSVCGCGEVGVVGMGVGVGRWLWGGGCEEVGVGVRR